MAKKSTPFGDAMNFYEWSKQQETNGADKPVRTFEIAYADFKDAAEYEDQNLVDVWKESRDEFNRARIQLQRAIDEFRRFLDIILRDGKLLRPEDMHFEFRENDTVDGLVIEVFKEAPKKRGRQRAPIERKALGVFESPPLEKLRVTQTTNANAENVHSENPQPRSRNAA